MRAIARLFAPRVSKQHTYRFLHSMASSELEEQVCATTAHAVRAQQPRCRVHNMNARDRAGAGELARWGVRHYAEQVSVTLHV
jgi:phage baseplate assembly protein W